MSTPQSTIKICSGVRLNPSYEHTIYFPDKSSQLGYFAGKVVKTFSAYSFIRKSWDLKVEASMEEAKTWTYLYFSNGSSGKTYFYFIKNIEYVNDLTVMLSLEIDVMQTYLFDYELLPCFVDREHASTDEVGDNTLDEGLELGELKVNFQTTIDELSRCCILVMSTFNPMTTTEEYTETVLSANYNDLFSGLGIYAVDILNYATWGEKLAKLDEYGKSDGIVSMWMYPKSLVTLANGESWSDGKLCHKVAGSNFFQLNFTKLTQLDGYTPKNKKLLTYPYNFAYVSNNMGSAGVYRYERFYNPELFEFKVIGAISPEGGVGLLPLDYNGTTLNFEEGMTLSGYPTCAWNQDIYKLWLAQNQNQHNLGLVSAGLTIAGGIVGMVMTGGVGALASGGAVVSGVSQIANHLSQKADKEIQPPQAKGNFSASVNYVNDFMTFTYQQKGVDKIHAKIIDDYFDMYGYKTNQVKIPNRAVRKNWTFTKTVGCHIKGNLCTDDLVKIESIYNNGVTFWKNGDNIGNYTLSNTIS